MITAAQVKELRELTGSGIMDCKKVLVETEGDVKKAVDLLRERGVAQAAKKAGRIASEGLVDSYIHNGKYGAMVEINSETDFVSKNEEFVTFVRDIAMHVAAMNPQYVSREEVPTSVLEAEKEIIKQQALNEGKPEAVVEKMVEGRLNKYLADICLLDQPFVKDQDKTVKELLTEKIATIGENIVIRRFVRFERGEGLEKREEDFAEEVMKQING
ncbi:MAG: translation elongation factor Ts [Clostridia bacterium]|nr:translation elongation factor Ts [Clostridia bacterium]MDD4375961.1 translation elongation factor Ts [Clostridia bacterium]